MKKPGEQTTLYYDSDAAVVDGDIIRTVTGRRYLVLDARRSPTLPRYYLDVVVMHPDDAATSGVVHELHWYSRRRRRI